MKFSAILAAAVLTLSANANANPIEHAQCAAIFKASAMTLQQHNPALAARANNISTRLKNLSDSVIGGSTATQYYVIKMNEMAAEMRAGNGNGVRQNELEYCAKMARNFGML